MTNEQFDEIIYEIIEERSDRALVILSSSIIDEQLFQILNTFLKASSKQQDDLLNGDNPLSTFSAKIKIIYRLGIIDDSFREILDQVRKVRNLCAHNIDININKAPIKDHIFAIKKYITIRNAFELVKQRYFKESYEDKYETKAILITIVIMLKAIIKSIIRIEDNKKTILILAK